MRAPAKVKKLRTALTEFSTAVRNCGSSSEESAQRLDRFFGQAPLVELINFIAEVQVMCSSPFYMVEGDDSVSKALQNLGPLRTYQLREHLKSSVIAVKDLDKSDIIQVAESSHPVVMTFLINTTGVGSKDFVRKDEKGREEQLGIELGL